MEPPLPLPHSDILAFLKSNKKARFTQEEAESLLEAETAKFPQVFYLLSDSNKVLSAATYKKSFLFRNLKKFKEEDFYYITEGIKNQIFLGFDDFFIVIHRFFSIELLVFVSVQRLLLHLLQSFDYKMREFLICTDLAVKLCNNLHSVDPIFGTKWLRLLISTESPVFTSFVEDLCLEVTIPEPAGCMKFFKAWYLGLKRPRVKITFVS